MLKFDQMELPGEISRAITDLGFEEATQIQSDAIPLMRQGADIIGRSQTGTGKTLAFAVPAVELIDPDVRAVQVLVLCPTRELALQACGEVRKIARYKRGVEAAEVYGGASFERQFTLLRRANIVVGTPGRVMDHMRRGTLKLDRVALVVLDEADEMLSMGFREDIETILSETPESRRTALFSATMPPEILALTRKFQRDPVLVEVEAPRMTVDSIEQFYCAVPMGKKLEALDLLLQYHRPRLALVFANTKTMVDEITEFLGKNNYNAEGLHGDMKQAQRTKVMESFKRGKTSVLVATDVAARGIDVSGIEYVINYDVPQSAEYYTHRVGRTGRAGKSGRAVTLCCGGRQLDDLYRIKRFVRCDITKMSLPSPADIRRSGEEAILDALRDAVDAGEFSHVSLVDALEAEGFSLKDIASAALELRYGKPRETAALIEPRTHSAFARKEGSAGPAADVPNMALSIGRSCGVAPAHIVAAVAQATGLNGGDIGRIEIRDDVTLVAVPESELANAVSAMNRSKIRGKQISATAYAYKKPDNRPRAYPARDRAERRDYDKRDRNYGKDYRSLPPKKRGR
ncbi:MAG: DEAD/DEAH box helicase [Clostridiaceae bacterium]|nr:DEAD/DEAH box helicase [Eubacteriales bacterium]